MKLNVGENDSLLSEPSPSFVPEKIDRPTSEIIIHEIFDIRRTRRQFSCQYAHSYTVRLFPVRERLEAEVKKEWPGVDIKKIAELCEYSQALTTVHNGAGASDKTNKRDSDDHGQHITFREGVTVVVIGTIFKYQPEKPSILQELSEDNPMVPVVPKTKYTSDKDTIQLEDETTRVQLVSSAECGMTVGGVVNGIICAVKGKPTSNGKFEVIEVIFPSAKPKPGLDIRMNCSMVFVSGLNFDVDSHEAVLKMDVLFDYLAGLGGSPLELEQESKYKTKVFFVGNTFLRYITGEGKHQRIRMDIAQKLDEALDQLCQTMDVLMLPGENDPTEPMLPQVPMHRCIFPTVSRRSTFKALTNPARIEIPVSAASKSPRLDVLLSGGQNLKDALRNSDVGSPIEMAVNLLRWGHICPTAPDTLPLHPGVKDDVFVVEQSPDVFAIGNQERFEAVECKGTKIVTIPSFSETGSVVLMDEEMNFHPVTFKFW